MNASTYSLKRTSLFGILALFVSAMLVLAGCGGAKDNAADKSGQGAGQEYTVKHAMGETKIPATPKRIVVLTNEGTEALLSMGVKPVGAVKSWTGNPWYDHIKDKMEGVEALGEESQPNLEKIAALKPDLILGNKMRHEKIYQQLSAIAPTVFSETLRSEWKTNFKLYAEAINKKAEGEKVIADFDKHVADVKAKLGDKINTKVSIVRFMPGRTRIYYNDTFAGVILKQLGVPRPAAQDKPTFADEVTKERIPEMEGDILVYFTYEQGKGEATKLEQEWTNDPLWKNLNVVKKGKAYKVNDTIWNTAGGVLAANLLLDDIEKLLSK